MANILRVKMRWTGFIGGPGYSVFHMRDFNTDNPDNAQAVAALARISTFANAIKGFVPSQITLTPVGDVEVIEDTTGELVNVLSGGTPAGIVGTVASTNGFASAVGMNITWRTAGIRNGRRVRGRTFLVPLTMGTFINTGQPGAGAMTDISAAAAGLANASGSPDLGVYCRPSSKGATDGSWHAVTNYSVPALASVLRSRRD